MFGAKTKIAIFMGRPLITTANDLFQLIVTSTSEGEPITPYSSLNGIDNPIVRLTQRALTTPKNCNNVAKPFNSEEACTVPATFDTKPSKMIITYSKISIHSCKDCKIFCVGELEQR